MMRATKILKRPHGHASIVCATTPSYGDQTICIAREIVCRLLRARCRVVFMRPCLCIGRFSLFIEIVVTCDQIQGAIALSMCGIGALYQTKDIPVRVRLLLTSCSLRRNPRRDSLVM